MRKLLSAVVLIAMASVAMGAVAPRQDYSSDTSEMMVKRGLRFMQGSSQTLGWRFTTNGTSAQVLSGGNTVLFYYTPSDRSWMQTSTGSVESASDGRVIINFTPAMLNTNTLDGTFDWRMTVSDTTSTLAYAYGELEIIEDITSGITNGFPTSTGIVNWLNYSYQNTVTAGPVLPGSNISSRLGPNGSVYFDLPAIGDAASIQSNIDAIVSHDLRISTNADAIAVAGTNIANLATGLGSVGGLATNNAAGVASNIGAIASHDLRITTNLNLSTANALGIASNISDVASLTLQVSSNDTDIASTVLQIASNDTDISSLTLQVSSNDIDIAANSDTGAAHTASIADLQTSTNAAFLVTTWDNSKVGLYTNFDTALAATPDDGIVDCIRLGEYDWMYNILPSNGVTVLGHGGLTLHQTNQNQYIIMTSGFTNTFSGVTFKSATTNGTLGTLYFYGGAVGHFTDCVFTNALSPAKAGLAMNTASVHLRDTDLQGVIAGIGTDTVNDYGGSVWSSTTVDVTNRFGSALTVGGYTVEELMAGTVPFTGPATTGTVTSTDSDTNKFLMGDGTWGVPAAGGDFLADGTVPMAGDIDVGGNTITNLAAGVSSNDAANVGQMNAAIAAGGGGSGSSAHTYMIGTGEWGGDQVGAGSLGSGTNNVVWAGYSTANATNNVNAGDAWYSSQPVLNDKYYFSQFTFERDTSLALESIWIGVRSSATSPLTNKVNILLDDTVTIFATNNLYSTTANVWNWYGPYAPVAWTNTLPTWVNGVRTNFGLNVRADVFCSHSNTIQLKVESRINTP